MVETNYPHIPQDTLTYVLMGLSKIEDLYRKLQRDHHVMAPTNSKCPFIRRPPLGLTLFGGAAPHDDLKYTDHLLPRDLLLSSLNAEFEFAKRTGTPVHRIFANTAQKCLETASTADYSNTCTCGCGLTHRIRLNVYRTAFFVFDHSINKRCVDTLVLNVHGTQVTLDNFGDVPLHTQGCKCMMPPLPLPVRVDGCVDCRRSGLPLVLPDPALYVPRLEVPRVWYIRAYPRDAWVGASAGVAAVRGASASEGAGAEVDIGGADMDARLVELADIMVQEALATVRSQCQGRGRE